MVRDRVEEVYINNKRMMSLQIDLHHPETVAEVNKDIVVLTSSSEPDESAFLCVLSTIAAKKTSTDFHSDRQLYQTGASFHGTKSRQSNLHCHSSHHQQQVPQQRNSHFG